MTTREVENGTLKCHRYWPDPASQPPMQAALLGGITITHLKTEQHANFAVRRFRLDYKGETREVTHLAYESWPDHGVPLTTDEFLQFRQAFRSVWDRYPGTPAIAHCSAGVGRTGTLIAIDW